MKPADKLEQDTFGVDLGEERPELEVWNLGLTNILEPMGTFLLKSFVARFVLWTIAWSWIAYLLILVGIIGGSCYALNIRLVVEPMLLSRNFRLRCF